MSDFCDFVPDDPSCQVPDPVDPVGPDSDGMMMDDDMDMDMDESMGRQMKMANLAYIMVPFAVLVQNIGYEFRYSDIPSY